MKEKTFQSDKDRNRAEFPEIAKIIDEFRKVFGEVKLIWGKENEKEIGKRRENNNSVSVNNMVIEGAKSEKKTIRV